MTLKQGNRVFIVCQKSWEKTKVKEMFLHITLLEVDKGVNYSQNATVMFFVLLL